MQILCQTRIYIHINVNANVCAGPSIGPDVFSQPYFYIMELAITSAPTAIFHVILFWQDCFILVECNRLSFKF